MTYIKKLITTLLGRNYSVYLKYRYRQKLWHQYLYDYRRYEAAASNSWRRLGKENKAAQIALECHRIEKGLTLLEPKAYFGLDVVQKLIRLIQDYEDCFGPSHETIRARAAVASYFTAQKQDEKLQFIPESFRSSDSAPSTITLTKDDLDRTSGIDFQTFARGRHSLRQFTGAPVSTQAVSVAVSIAQTAPSVCNRQSGRVHCVTGKAAIQKALSFQNGNRGFGHLAGAVMIVTSDMRIFSHSYERNQCWVDGGLFAMMLQLGFHAQGLGSCMLNWSADSVRDISMREAFNIPDHEAVITMMAVGHVPEKIVVARSERLPIERVVQFHPPLKSDIDG